MSKLRERSPLRRGIDARLDADFPHQRPWQHGDSSFHSAGNVSHISMRPISPSREYPESSSQSYPLEIVLVPADQSLRTYALAIEKRLKNLGLLTFIEVLRPGGLFVDAVDYWARRGALYIIQLEKQHETHYSLTLNILHGTKQEHRNMPVDDALSMIRNTSENFFVEQFMSSAMPSREIKSLQQLATPRHIAYLLHLLADCRYVSVEELTTIVNYVDDRRRMLAKDEGKVIPLRKEEEQQRIQDANMIQAKLVSMMNQGSQSMMQQPAVPVSSNLHLSNVSMPQRSLVQEQQMPTPVSAAQQQQQTNLSSLSSKSQTSNQQDKNNSIAPAIQKALDSLRSLNSSATSSQATVPAGPQQPTRMPSQTTAPAFTMPQFAPPPPAAAAYYQTSSSTPPVPPGPQAYHQASAVSFPPAAPNMFPPPSAQQQQAYFQYPPPYMQSQPPFQQQQRS